MPWTLPPFNRYNRSMPPVSRKQQKAACADLNRIRQGKKGQRFKSEKVAMEFCVKK